MRFHLVHVIPHPRMHGLNGYREVIDTVAWGLQALGHDVSSALNAFSQSAVNIVFGAQVLAAKDINSLPDHTIIYNMEQMRGHGPDIMRKQFHACAERFRIWDYSLFNRDSWQAVGPKWPVAHVPISYAPVLERIPRDQEKQFDVLIYGWTGAERLEAFSALSKAGIACVFACGLYGGVRDDLVAKARIVLNVTLYRSSRIFEIVRVSYLLANAKAVVALSEDGLGIEDGLTDAVRFCDAAQLVDTVEALLADEGARQNLESAGRDFMVARDIRPVLRQALDGANFV